MNHTLLASARSFLFVPGNRPERFAKALDSGADAVILDLEDAVPASQKDGARRAIQNAWADLKDQPIPVLVRINAWDSEHQALDLATLLALPGLSGVVLPKADGPDHLAALHQALPQVGILPLIESATGYLALASLAAAPGVVRLVVGHIDFMADTGIQSTGDELELLPLRFAVAMHTRARGLAPAVDGVTTTVHDEQRLVEDTHRALRLGLGAKLCIHPKQVVWVHQAMRPNADALEWAKRVVAADHAAGGAAVQLDGRMVDAPVVLQARRILAWEHPHG